MAAISQRRSQATKTLVGLYRAADVGIDTDSETPYVTVCEPHGNMVCSRTLALARATMTRPDDWCDDCQKALEVQS